MAVRAVEALVHHLVIGEHELDLVLHLEAVHLDLVVLLHLAQGRCRGDAGEI